VKRLRASPAGIVFQIRPHERHLLLEVLQLYPLVPASHHRLTREAGTPQSDEDQRLLEESLSEQRQEHRQQVRGILSAPERFHAADDGWELTLAPAEIEWLLQVLNDVRVGSWLALGGPEADQEPEETEQNAGYLLALHACGMFQSCLLAALGVSELPEWSD